MKLYALEIAGKVVTPYSFTIKPDIKNNTDINASNVKLYLNGSTTAFNDANDVLSITKIKKLNLTQLLMSYQTLNISMYSEHQHIEQVLNQEYILLH